MREIRFIVDENKKENIARSILEQLPEWFGIPESTNEYIQNSKRMPFWACFEDNGAIGFIVLKETSNATAEIYVMGVLKAYHRKGIGHLLFEVFQEYAKAQEYQFLQVKTVKKGYYKEYDITNTFYEKLGFKELECFPALWDEWNPCQIYIKYIGIKEI